MQRDLHSTINTVATLAPAIRTSDGTGATVDLQGYDSAAFVVLFGAYTDGSHTPIAQESANGTDWDAVAAGDLIGAFDAVAAIGGANTVQRVGYAGNKRYVRLFIDITGTTNGAASAAVIVRGHPTQA